VKLLISTNLSLLEICIPPHPFLFGVNGVTRGARSATRSELKLVRCLGGQIRAGGALNGKYDPRSPFPLQQG
jgi:hypothetical protein